MGFELNLGMTSSCEGDSWEPRPDGTRLYTANGPSNDVSVVETSTLTMLRKVAVGQSPWGVAVVPR